jgi:hypothetical protein
MTNQPTTTLFTENHIAELTDAVAAERGAGGVSKLLQQSPEAKAKVLELIAYRAHSDARYRTADLAWNRLYDVVAGA